MADEWDGFTNSLANRMRSESERFSAMQWIGFVRRSDARVGIHPDLAPNDKSGGRAFISVIRTGIWEGLTSVVEKGND
ncbi:hypothetical protein CDAR_407191 [Caerostris darwini]|uniref:Uncharacterized protein n=1 Tax=Caerostris darwini TaxID=1538125 RepID=A0AAV4Q0S2_9ARAC|nr:hypothetical protein CDAR_407191 [Caerostris darwini]